MWDQRHIGTLVTLLVTAPLSACASSRAASAPFELAELARVMRCPMAELRIEDNREIEMEVVDLETGRGRPEHPLLRTIKGCNSVVELLCFPSDSDCRVQLWEPFPPRSLAGPPLDAPPE